MGRGCTELMYTLMCVGGQVLVGGIVQKLYSYVCRRAGTKGRGCTVLVYTRVLGTSIGGRNCTEVVLLCV